MAKELPFFKFEPNQWDNGNIQIFSREVKGLFIDICSMYWSRLGDLPYKLALKKLCDGNATALDSLCEENIIALQEEKIVIKFLDEQLSEFDQVSKQNSRNAKQGWQKRRANATALRPQCDRNAIREEKRREEKIRIEDREKNFKKEIFEHSQKYNKEMLENFFLYWSEKTPGGKKMKFEQQKTWETTKRLASWASKQFNQNGSTQKNSGSDFSKDENRLRRGVGHEHGTKKYTGKF